MMEENLLGTLAERGGPAGAAAVELVVTGRVDSPAVGVDVAWPAAGTPPLHD